MEYTEEEIRELKAKAAGADLFKLKLIEIAFNMDFKGMTEDEGKEELLSFLGSGGEKKCECKKPKFTRQVTADFEPMCGECGRQLK